MSVLSPIVSAFGEDLLIIGMNRWDNNSVQNLFQSSFGAPDYCLKIDLKIVMLSLKVWPGSKTQFEEEHLLHFLVIQVMRALHLDSLLFLSVA